MENNKTIRSNKAQIKYLCHYMAQNPSFASGELRTPLEVKNNNKQWLVLKQALDELGPKRSVNQWKISWRDQKQKAREEEEALNKVKNIRGNFVDFPKLSENSSLVLSAIGKEMAEGCGPDVSLVGCGLEESQIGVCGPEESQISFKQEPREATTSGQQVPKWKAPRRVRQAMPQVEVPRRVRRAVPHDRFLNAQLELNNLMKELIREVRRSNDLSEKRLNFMCGECNKRK